LRARIRAGDELQVSGDIRAMREVLGVETGKPEIWHGDPYYEDAYYQGPDNGDPFANHKR
jgi:hypothetical protein